MSQAQARFDPDAISIEVDLKDWFIDVEDEQQVPTDTVQLHAPTLLREIESRGSSGPQPAEEEDESLRTVNLQAPTLLRELEDAQAWHPAVHTGHRPIDLGESAEPLVCEAPTRLHAVEDQPDDKPDDKPKLVVETADRTFEITVNDSPFILGRSRSCDGVVDDVLVSRRHAILERRPNGWFVVDQASGNGTAVEELRIKEARLCHGDVIRMGNAVVEFHLPTECRTRIGPIEQRTVLFHLEGRPAPVAEAAAKPRKGKMLFVLGIALVLIVAAVFLLKLANEPSAPEPAAPGDPVAEVRAAVVTDNPSDPAIVPEAANDKEETPEPEAVAKTEPAADASAPVADATVLPVGKPVTRPAPVAVSRPVLPATASEPPADWVEPWVDPDEVKEEQEGAWAEEVDPDEAGTLLREASLAAYLAGDLDAAVEHAESSGVDANGAAALGRIQELLDRCKLLFRASETVEPVEVCLWDAYELDASLGGGAGKVRSDIRSWLGKLYYYLAVKEKNLGNLGAAMQDVSEALRYDPDLEPAWELRGKIEWALN